MQITTKKYMIILRDYQKDAIDKIRKSYKNGYKSPILVLPTGGGKTIIFSYIAHATIQKNNNVLILVHRDSLFKQTSKTLIQFGVRHGLIGAGYGANYTYNCQIAKIGTMANRLDKFKPNLIIIDECHHATASTYKKIINAYPDAKVLGVTATPCRTDGVGLSDMFDDMIIGSSINNLIDHKYLVSPRIYVPPTNIDLSEVKITGGDYNRNQLESAVNRPKITGDVVSHYKKMCNGLPGIVFCVSVKHAEHVASEFCNSGIIAHSVHGGMKQGEIDNILNGLYTGKIDVITSCDLISEGTDIPAVGCVMLLRPTISESLYLQQIGRALRPFEGKEFAIVLDHVGNTLKHGHPCDDREWSLDAVKKSKRKSGEKNINIKTCKSCFYTFQHKNICPLCGAEVEQKERVIEKTDGELVEIGMIKKQKRMEIGKARTLVELEKIERERGYKKGWAYNVFINRK